MFYYTQPLPLPGIINRIASKIKSTQKGKIDMRYGVLYNEINVYNCRLLYFQGFNTYGIAAKSDYNGVLT